MARTRPKKAVRQGRKRQLAARDGWRCTYCRRRFRTLAEATTDHVVPYRLLRTWSVGALVLACLDCNHRKADRFPLSLALVLLRSIDPTRPVIRPADLPLLARLAHTNQSARPDAPRSTPNLPESTANHPIERTAA